MLIRECVNDSKSLRWRCDIQISLKRAIRIEDLVCTVCVLTDWKPHIVTRLALEIRGFAWLLSWALKTEIQGFAAHVFSLSAIEIPIVLTWSCSKINSFCAAWSEVADSPILEMYSFACKKHLFLYGSSSDCPLSLVTTSIPFSFSSTYFPYQPNLFLTMLPHVSHKGKNKNKTIKISAKEIHTHTHTHKQTASNLERNREKNMMVLPCRQLVMLQ